MSSAAHVALIVAFLAALAARQHGVLSRAQLLELGLRSSALARRVDSGRLHSVHLGVYSVGHPILDRRGRWMAAVLACGRGAALGYSSAAVLWNLQRTSSGPPTSSCPAAPAAAAPASGSIATPV